MTRQGNSMGTRAAALAALVGLAAGAARADFSHPGCAPVTDADFTVVPLITNAMDATTSEPLKMAFDRDAEGNVDVYFTQRFGMLRKYVGATKKVVELHKFAPLLTGSSDGLQGIALDPAFKQNRWIYLFYTGSASEWRVSRFTLNGDKLDVASEKILLRITEDGPSQHPGGALMFDPEGNLWITSGDNNKPIQAANSNDLRGKILRIRPMALPEGGTAPVPGVGTTYTVPAGNLRDVFNTTEGKDKIRPEIYVMGTRNAYTLGYDAKRKMVAWGDVGPDAGKNSEEHNLTAKPGNFGWPFYAGDNLVFGGGGTAEKPINTDGTNTGVKELPPAIPALHSYRQNCAIAGGVYYFDATLKSDVKWPPHFDGAWMAGDFGHDSLFAFKLDAAGAKITDRMQVGKAFRWNNPLDMQMGPDGALYVMNYAGYRSTSAATGLYRVEYKGACKVPVSLAGGAPGRAAVLLRGTKVSVSAVGRHEVEVQDLAGRRVAFHSGEGPAEYGLEAARGPGVYLVKVRAGRESFTGKLVR